MELAQALQHTATSAKLAGVDINHLIAYVGTVSSVTRKSADTIGESFKTMFARMEDIKANKIDEDGIGLNNVESALSRIGVKLRDSKYDFRSMADVMDEIGTKWKDLSEVEQQNIAKSIAGVRQKETFIALMQNQTQVQTLLTAETNSTGLATERYGIYLESVEAKSKKMQSALEGVWQKTINSESIGQVYDMVTGILKLIDSVGGFIPIITALAIAIGGVKLAMMGLNGQLLIQNALIDAEVAMQPLVIFFGLLAEGATIADAALVAFNITLGITEILTGAVVLALAGAVLGIGYMSQESDRATQHLNDLSKAVKDANDSLIKTEQGAKTVSDLGKSFDELKNKSILTTEEQQKFIDVQNQLKDIMPELSGHYDDQGNFVLALDTNQKMLNKTQQEAIKLQKEKLELAAEEAMRGKLDMFNHLEAVSKSSQDMANTDWGKEVRKSDPATAKNMEIDDASLRKQSFDIKDFINQSKMDFSNLSEDQQKFWANYLRTQGEAGIKLADELLPIEDKWAKTFNAIDKKGGSAKDSLKAFVDEVSKSKDVLNNSSGGIYAPSSSLSSDEQKQKTKETLTGLAEIQTRLVNTSETYNDYKNLAIKAFEAVGYEVDNHGKVYTNLTTTVDGVTTTTKKYVDGLSVLSENEQEAANDAYKLTDAYISSKKAADDASEGLFQINTQLKNLQDSAALTGGLVARASTGGAFDFADVQKLTDANKDYLQFIDVIDGQVKINTEGLRQYDIKKAEDNYLTMKQQMSVDGLTESEQKQLDLMHAYIISLADGSAYADDMAKAQKKLADEQEKAAKDAFDAEKKYQEEVLKGYEDQKKAADDLLKLVIDMIKQEKQAEKDHLNDQMQNYNDLIDKRIQALDALKAEEDYKKGLKKDEKKVSDIKSQIAILSLDNSPEAKNKILKLQADLAASQEKVNDDISAHKLKLEKDALTGEKKRFDDLTKDKIKIIDNYLKETGKITQDALDLIQHHGEQLYARLIDWNRVYGDGLDSTVVTAWNHGYEAAQHYDDLLVEISSQHTLVDNMVYQSQGVVDAIDPMINKLKDYSAMLDEIAAKKIPPPITGNYVGGPGTIPSTPGLNPGIDIGNGDGTGTSLDGGGTSGGGEYKPPATPIHHSGLDAGPVGGLKTSTNERLIKALDGEVLINQYQQENILNRVLPNIPQFTPNHQKMSESFNIGSLMTFNGPVDKSVLPDIEKIANKVIDVINKGNLSRGIRRPTNLTGI